MVRIPGTNLTLGLDALIGLVPGFGDLAGTALSGLIMVEAVRLQVPVRVLVQMGGNLLLDTAIGVLPFVGDAADVVHRANRKNLRLLERAVARGELATGGHAAYLARAVAVIGVSLGVCLAGAGLSLFLLWRLVTS